METHTHTHTKNKKKKKKRITGINNHWSLVSLNIKGLKLPIKRHRLTEWIQKHPSAAYKKHTSTLKAEITSE